MNGMKMIPVALALVTLGSLTSCPYYPYIPPNPTPPVNKTRACTGSDFAPPFVQLSRNKAKVGDTVLMASIPGPLQQPQNFDLTQNTYTQIDPATCPKIKLIRLLIGDAVIGEIGSEPYRLSFTLKAGEKGIPASNASNAGTTVDVPINAQTVYADDKTSQYRAEFGSPPFSNFLSIDYPAVP
jgi:hypothetical protein